jgi:archaellum component FlaC
MSNFLGRNKHKSKRDKHANTEYLDYADNPEKLKQKFIEKSKASWGECEYLYAIRATSARSRRLEAPGGGGGGDQDAVLALFYMHEDSRVVFVPFEYTHTFEVGPYRFLEDIHQINNDENNADIGISFGDSEFSWRIAHYTVRDDFVCILSQLSKNTAGLSIPTSGQQPPDANFREKGYKNKYPVLFKLLDATTSNSTTQEDEKEAEVLLEQLDWTKPVPGLQAQLQDDILTLNVEICDLLLQWEDDEASGTSSGDASSHIRDTVELLTTLNHVDKELGFVDDWLGNQIDHLSQVQSEIKQIESESGTLETSLQNLTAVKSLISSVTKSLQLSRAHEDTLVKADKNLKLLLVSSSVLLLL